MSLNKHYIQITFALVFYTFLLYNMYTDTFSTQLKIVWFLVPIFLLSPIVKSQQILLVSIFTLVLIIITKFLTNSLDDLIGYTYYSSILFMSIGIIFAYRFSLLTSEANEINKKLSEKQDKLIKQKERQQDIIKTSVQKSIEQEKALIKQSKHAMMGEMLTMITHQWKQPLNAINARVMILNMQHEMDILDDKNFAEHIHDLQESVKFLSETIDDFRYFFSKDKKSVGIKVSELIDKTLRVISSRVNKIELNVINVTDLTMKTHPNELQQVLLSILNNAIDELLEKEIIEPRLSINIECNSNGLVEIDIYDNAGGIPDDIINNIFDPYFSTKAKNGTGLGLYIAKMITEESLKGELKASNKHEGALFSLTIPSLDKL